jgi:hypothetical protein
MRKKSRNNYYYYYYYYYVVVVITRACGDMRKLLYADGSNVRREK